MKRRLSSAISRRRVSQLPSQNRSLSSEKKRAGSPSRKSLPACLRNAGLDAERTRRKDEERRRDEEKNTERRRKQKKETTKTVCTPLLESEKQGNNGARERPDSSVPRQSDATDKSPSLLFFQKNLQRTFPQLFLQHSSRQAGSSSVSIENAFAVDTVHHDLLLRI
ncbi:hypothetical protein TGDOM2_301260 [Toxoplasma gondii GAB2-2007-GAL-DOM2]|uniref:Uncharacterized protein n=3 Tax=Toxoplasma gondii TaxID=5811 RepID=A0A2G8XMQ2_TOXGO|nr:hypothetical protein TGDOM2_301260 [Toxoplasma gondii GAB2-2007-GAL-DOM2]KFG35231.1 hypothetical protein TGFOU_301260 [Toxoplasma gondii FOU]PIL96297.1 hypothetical protein TGCOUG_301260 [Toxoplasma gondii COUG]